METDPLNFEAIQDLNQLSELIKSEDFPEKLVKTLIGTFDQIKCTKFLLIMAADFNEDYGNQSSFSLYKEVSQVLLETIIKPLIERCKKPNNEQMSQAPQLIAKWWVNYFSILGEVYEKKREKINWNSEENDWFSLQEEALLKESLNMLEDHLHWKMLLYRSIGAKKMFLSKVSRNNIMEDFLIFSQLKNYYISLLNREIDAIKKSLKKEDDFAKYRLEFLISLKENIEKELPGVHASLLCGYFGKNLYKNLNHSVIFGDDGGFYSLINRIDEKEKKMLLALDNISDEYLGFCTREQKNGLQKIIIGKGTFGTIRVCMALTRNETSLTLKPGQIVCVKKTAYINKPLMNEEGKIIQNVTSKEIRENCWNDYSVGEVGSLVFSPEVYDMVIIEPVDGIDKIHCKGYTLQKFVPVYDGSKIFSENGKYFNVWPHQRSYLIHIFEVTSRLLDKGICMTDMKPQNTLYDGENYRGMLIDLAGVVRKHSRKDLENINVKDIKEFTKEYTAIEILNAMEAQEYDEEYEYDEDYEEEEVFVDLCKCMSYSLGMMINKIVLRYNNGKPYQKELQTLAEQLRSSFPKKRHTVEQALEILKKIGADEIDQKIAFQPFVDTLLAKINENYSKFGMNSNLDKIQNSFINLTASPLDPCKYEKLPQVNLEKELDQFLFSSEKHENIFVLLGSSGSGKSTILQLKFLEFLKKWKENDPIPIYINLSVEDDLKARWKWFCEITNRNDLNFNIFSGYSKYPVIVFIDSFDEVPSKINYVSKFLDDLGNNPLNKCVICCRSEFIQKDSDFVKYFKPLQAQKGELLKRYIIPLTFTNLEFDEYIRKYYSIWHQNQTEFVNIEEILLKIKEKNLKNLMTTSFMVHLTLEVLPEIISSGEDIITRLQIYEKYSKKKCLNVDQGIKEFLVERFSPKLEKYHIDTEYLSIIEHAALYLSSILHKNSCTKLDLNNGKEFFSNYHYDKNITCLENQIFVGIMRALNLSVEIRGNIPNENVTIGFEHDSIKNYYLIQAIMNECSQMNSTNKILNILGARLIVEDEALVLFLVESVKRNLHFKKQLIEIVFESKIPAADNTLAQKKINAAANAISLLVASNHNFSGFDLKSIKICGANIRDGIFCYCDFTNADLSNVVLENCKLDGALFHNTNLQNIKMGCYPDIRVKHPISSCCFSKSGDEILCTSNFGVAVYNYRGDNSGKISKVFAGQNMAIFSPDEKFILSDSSDYTIKLWDRNEFCLLRVYEGHQQSITSLEFSSDGKFFASSSIDKTIKVWDTDTGELLKCLDSHCHMVYDLSISFDQKEIIGAYVEEIILWNWRESKILNKYIGHEKIVHSVRFSKDDSLILSASADCNICLWEKKSAVLLKTFKGHTDIVNLAIFSADESQILSCSDDCTIVLWDKETGEAVRNFKGHESGVNSICYSFEDKTIISGSKDKRIIAWDENTGTILRTCETNQKQTQKLSFSTKKKEILSGSTEGSVKLWDYKSFSLITTLYGHTNRVKSAIFLEDDSLILSCSLDKSIILWEKNSGKLKKTFMTANEGLSSIISQEDEKTFWSASSCLELWDLETGSILKTIEFPKDLAFYLPFDYHHKTSSLLCGLGNSLQLIDSKTSETKKTFDGHKADVLWTKFSPDGCFALSTSKDKTIKLWDINSSALVRSFDGHTGNVINAIFSEDMATIVSVSIDTSMKIWDISTGMVLKTYVSENNSPTCVAFLPNEDIFISGSSDKLIKIWDKTTSSLLKTYEGHTVNLMAVAISQNGRYIASVGKEKRIKFWDKETASLLRVLDAHTNIVTSLAFSHDDKYIASGSNDKTVKLWDRNTGALLKSFSGHTMGINYVLFSPNGSFIISGSSDGTVKIWDIENGKLAKSIENKKSSVSSLAVSSDGAWIFAGYDCRKGILWEISTGSFVRSFEGFSSEVSSVDISLNSCHVALGSFDKTIRLWNLKKESSAQKVLMGHTDAIYTVCFSPDNLTLLSGALDKTIRLWCINTGLTLKTFNENLGGIKMLAFSSKGDYFVSASIDKTVRIWNKIDDYKTQTVFSENGSYILTLSDNEKDVCLWEKQGNLLHIFQSESEIRLFKFSNDASKIILINSDEILTMWDFYSKSMLLKIASAKELNFMAFSSSGKSSVVGKYDGSVSIFEMKSELPSKTFGNLDEFLSFSWSSEEFLNCLNSGVNFNFFNTSYLCSCILSAKETLLSGKNMVVLGNNIGLSSNNLEVLKDKGAVALLNGKK